MNGTKSNVFTRPLRVAMALLVLLAGFVALHAGGCYGPAEGPGSSTRPAPFKVALIANGPLNDYGYNQAHEHSLKNASGTLGEKVSVESLGNVPETGDAERVIRRLIDNGANMIIASSFGYQDTTVKLAKEYPKVTFLQAWGFKPAPNLGTYSSQMYEAWYTMGVVAGRMTRSNRLGVVAAHPIPPMKWQINAYVLGARSVNPRVTVAVTFINHWFDPTLADTAANALVDQGCDVLCGVLDNSVAVATAAEKRGVMLIGHNADLSQFAPTRTLVGTRWQWEPIYVNSVEQAMSGKFDGTSGDRHGGFSQNVVGMTDFGPMVPQNVRDEAMKARDDIAAGRLAVYAGPIKDQHGKTVVPAGKTLTHDEIMAMDWLAEGVN